MHDGLCSLFKTLAGALQKRLQHRPLMALMVARVWSIVCGIRAKAFLCGRFRCAYIASGVRLIGIARIQLGKNVVIGRGSWLNVNDRSPGPPAISIGDNSLIGIRNFFTAGRSIVLREYCLTTLGCAFIGSSHLYDNPMQSYMLSGATLRSDIYVGVNCSFGAGAQVIGNVCIGHGSVIGSGAVIRTDIPPFSLVVGNPAKVIKRFDFATKQWVRWPTEELQDGPPEEEYLEHLRSHHGFVIQPISVLTSSLGDII